MNRIFGSSSSKKPGPSLQDVIASTEARMGSIDIKIRKLDAELAKYKEQLGKLKSGPGKNAIQQRAMRILQQKKMYESQRDQLAQQTFNMESVALAKENAQSTIAIVTAMKDLNKRMPDVNAIEALQDDFDDIMDNANYIQTFLSSRSYQVPDDIDEDQLAAELEALEVDEPSYLDIKALDFVDEPPVEQRLETPERPEAMKTTA